MSLTKSMMRFSHELPTFGIGASIRNLFREISSGIYRKESYKVEIPGFGSILIRRGDSDYYTLTQTFRRREYSIIPPVQERIDNEYKTILKNGKTPVIIDAGANIGAATIWFRSIYPKSCVLAIEPDPENYRILNNNVIAYPSIKIIKAAVGSKPGFVSLITNKQSWAIQTARSDSGCAILTIPEAVKMVPNGVLLLVKIDIEGFEEDLFSENLEWINETFAIIIEPHDWLFPGKQISRNFQSALGTGDFEIFLNGGENLVYVRIN